MPGKIYERVYEIAVDQYGYFTSTQALEAGATRQSLEMMAKRDKVERVSHGVYRVNAIPVTHLDTYMEATLWPGRQRGILSHETVLELNGISDVNPEKINVTVPKRFRTHRVVPSMYVLHNADLDADEISSLEGIPTTTVTRAIEDCHRTHLGQALLEQALEDGFKRGLITRIEADKLREDILVLQPRR